MPSTKLFIPLTFYDMKLKAWKASQAKRKAEKKHPILLKSQLPPYPKHAADEVAVQCGNYWSIQKMADRNLGAGIQERKAAGMESGQLNCKDELFGLEGNECPKTININNGGTVYTATKTIETPRNTVPIIKRKQAAPSLFHKKPARKSTTANNTLPTNYSPRTGEGLRKVKASNVLKTRETIKCGGHTDTGARTRGLMYTVKRRLPKPEYWYALGEQE